MNEEMFYVGSGGGSGVFKPDDLPRFVSENEVHLAQFETTIYGNSNSGFFTSLDKAGSVAVIATANTWIDVVDIAGAGFLGNVVASHGYFAGSKTIGIQVEVDGRLWEWTETYTAITFPSTLVLGALWCESVAAPPFFPVAARVVETADALPSLPSYATSARPFLVPTSFLLGVGAPVLAFNESLIVRVKNSAVASFSQGQKAGCTFVLR